MPTKSYSRSQIESKLHEILDGIPLMLSFVDLNENYVLVNKRYETIFGKRREEIEGHHIRHLIGTEVYERSKPLYARVLKGETVTQEVTVTDVQKNRIRLDTKYVPIKEDNEIIGMVVISHDITERWAREKDQQLLGDLSAIYAQNLDEPATAAKVLDLLTDRLDCTGVWLGEIFIEDASVFIAYEKQTGTPINGLRVSLENYGKKLSEAYVNGEVVCVSDVTTDPMTKDNIASFGPLKIRSFLTIPLKRKGQLKAIVSVAKEIPHFWTKQEIVLAQSISETLWSNIENNRLLQELKESVSARDEFISVCSHELKTPLSSLKLIYEMAARELANNDPRLYSDAIMRKRIQISNMQIDRMTKLIDDMLEVSRITSGRLSISFTEVDLPEAVRFVLSSIQEQLDDLGMTVTLTATEPVKILADQFRIEQVITNLLTNAIKYGKTLPVSVTVTKAGNSGIITVKDQGIGMSKESIKKIFHRYERASGTRDASGLGLGLYITAQIVEAHKGTIHVHSEPGKGSEFVVEIPLA